MRDKLKWITFKGYKYADSGNDFFWLIYPSGYKSQVYGNEHDILMRIAKLKAMED